MKKKFLLLLTCMTLALTANAIPAKRGIWRIITLSDGSSVRAQLMGDEHAHFYADEKGNCYQADGTAFRLADRRDIVRKAQQHRAKAISSKRMAKVMPARKKVGGATGNDYTGAKKGLIILVDFTNKKFDDKHDVALYERIANEEGFTNSDGFKGSVHDYFSAQSYGKFNLTFDVVGPVHLEHPYSYYGKNDSNDDDSNPEQMIVDACKGVDAQVNFADYDWDGDGEVDQVFVLYAGLGEAAGGDENTVWPHEYQLDSKSLTLDGVKIDTYACSSEMTATAYNPWTGAATEWDIDGIGTICHEFSHCLGFPDLYDINYQQFGMGAWDLMDRGSYNGDDRGFVPAGYSSYERWCAGWLEPIELTEDMEVTGMKALSEGGEAYVIYNAANHDEYYLLENRQLTGWDAGLYGKGLLVLHVDYDADIWEWNMVNTIADYSGWPYYGPKNTHTRLTIIPADNKLKMDAFSSGGETYYELNMDDLPGDPYPYNNNNQLTNTSTPKASLYNNNTDGKKLMNISVTDITQNSDGTISFNFKNASTGSQPADPTPAGTLFHETFDQCAGKGGNDDLWTGAIANGTFVPDNEGWETYIDGVAYGANKCAKFGTGSKSGMVMTPYFTLSGEATLTVRVAPWGNGRENGLSIYYATEAAETSDDLLKLYEDDLTSGQWNEITLPLNGDGENYIIFLPTQRLFIDDVLIAVPEAAPTGIALAKPRTRAAGGRIYTVDGRFAGLDFNALKPGVYVVDGKKVVK